MSGGWLFSLLVPLLVIFLEGENAGLALPCHLLVYHFEANYIFYLNYVRLVGLKIVLETYNGKKNGLSTDNSHPVEISKSIQIAKENRAAGVFQRFSTYMAVSCKFWRKYQISLSLI